MQIMIWFLVAMMGLVFYGMIRNNQVYRERLWVIGLIGSKNREGIYAGESDEHRDKRWAAYDAVSYNEMVWKFWKPISSFYNIDEILE